MISLWLAIAGSVILDGEPGKDVAVYAVPHSEALEHILRTSTDADGRFEFPDLPPGTWSVAAVVGNRAETVRVQEGEVVRIEVPSGRVVRGRLTPGDEAGLLNIYRPTVPPVGSVPWALNKISAARGGGVAIENVYVNPPGTFELAGLHPGRYRIEVMTRSRYGIAEVDVGSPITDVEVELVPAGRLAGTVLVKDAPSEPYQVHLRSPKRDSTIVVGLKHGQFSIPRMMPGTYVARVQFRDGSFSEERELEVASGEPTNFLFDLRQSDLLFDLYKRPIQGKTRSR